MKIANISVTDWAGSVNGMSLEEEGFFWRMTRLMYANDGVFYDDDRGNASLMSVNIRVYKRLKERLLKPIRASQKPVITQRNGRLVNDRVVKEIERFCQARRAAIDGGHEGARRRWDQSEPVDPSDKIPANLPEVSLKFGGSLAEVAAKLHDNSKAEPNEINGLGMPPPNTPISTTKTKKKKVSKNIYTEQVISEAKTQLNMHGFSPERGVPPSSICIVDAEITEIAAPPAKVETPPETTSARLVPVDGATAMAAALRPDLADAHESAFWTPDGQLHVFNGFRAELLSRLNGDEMRLRNRLDQVAPYCEKKEGLKLMLAIRRQFANHAEGQRMPQNNVGAHRGRRAGMSMSDHYDDIFESEGDSK